jgi:hypothetical protein
MPVAGDICPTDVDIDTSKDVPPEKFTSDTEKFVALVKRVSPYLLDHKVEVRVMDDDDSACRGCTEWEKKKYVFTINLAYQDTSDWVSNYELLIHELAHHAVRSNDHLCRAFWEAVTNIGARLAQLALQEPDLFEGTLVDVEPITVKESRELQLVAMAQ